MPCARANIWTVQKSSQLRGVQLEEDFVKANQEWVKELEIMVATKVHAALWLCTVRTFDLSCAS